MSNEQNKPLNPVEGIKERSNYLRGTIAEGLKDEITGSLSADDTNLTKFHGIYQQTARELDSERKHQKLEPLYSFMVRVRVPGGLATPAQWLEMDRLSDTYANSTLKLTTRQAFQFHGIIKRNIKKHIAEINASMLDTIAACGDVNRNVMCSPNPELTEIHAEAYEFSKLISDHLTPQTPAYHEIWLDNELVAGRQRTDEIEPIYGKTYLPRKFKIAIAIPPDNDTDIYTNDLGLIAIGSKGKLTGFNLIVGGGMGTTLEDKRTYPRLGNLVGYYDKSVIVKIVEEVVKIQRDYGDRTDRKVSRFKYTIARFGIDWFVRELEKRSGVKALPAKPFSFEHTSDRYGWTLGLENKWHYTLFVENGRVKDTDTSKAKTALREIAKIHTGDFRLTGNQNVIIGNVSETKKDEIINILKKYNSYNEGRVSPVRLNSIACVALYTCSLAYAEAEIYLPSLIDKIEVLLKENNIDKQQITIRMTGCPNGCARPYNSEIGLIGRAPGTYNLYIGGSHLGNRLNTLYKEMLKEEQILNELDILFKNYSTNKETNEHFGDFVIRSGIIVPEVFINSI
jgi:sulfite reductase (NADPH) hemoprotein beta-component